MKQIPDKAQEILDRHVGRCMVRIERIKLDPETAGIIKDIVRKEMRFMAENIVEAQDGTD